MSIAMRKWLGRNVMLYRPTLVVHLEESFTGDWFPVYEAGPLRAKIFGVRVPLLWALGLIDLRKVS